MKKYRIVPKTENVYHIEMNTGILNSWHLIDVAGYLEKAKEQVQRFKEIDERWEKQRKEQEEFQKQNPPIYL